MNKKDEKKPSGDVRRTKLTLSVTAEDIENHCNQEGEIYLSDAA